jgi:hypothetical protein
MIAALSMLWPLMALASDREEGEASPLRGTIAALLALEDYESIIRMLGICPLEPLMENLNRQISNHPEDHCLQDHCLHISWREDLDPAWQFIVSYIRETSKTRTPGPRWLEDDWCKDYPDFSGLIQTYNSFTNVIAINYAKALHNVLASAKITSRYWAVVEQWALESTCGGMIPSKKANVQPPGWKDGFPCLPLDHGSIWFATLPRFRADAKELKICRCVERLTSELPSAGRLGSRPAQTLVWEVVFRGFPLALRNVGEATLEDPVILQLSKFCRQQGLFLLLLPEDIHRFIKDGAPLTGVHKNLVNAVPLLGKISDSEISYRFKLTMEEIKRMRRDNGIEESINADWDETS